MIQTLFKTDRHELSDAKRALLEKRLRGRNQAKVSNDATAALLSAANREEGPLLARLPRPLRPTRPSFTQERYLHLTKKFPAVTQHAQILRLTGRLDPGRLCQSLSAVVSRHEILRTAYPETPDGPIQDVLLPTPVVLDPETPPGDTTSARWEWVRRQGQTMQRQSLVTDRVAPFRLRLFQIDAHDHALLWIANHVLYDDWSNRILFEDLSAFYGGHTTPEPAIQHVEYSEWWRNRFRGECAERLTEFWRSTLDGCSTRVDVSLDSACGDWPYRTAEARLVLGALEATAVTRYAVADGATLFAVMLAATMASLSRWTGQRDILVGTSYADRTHRLTARVMGPLINWLPIRARFPERWRSGEVRRIVTRALFEAIEHHACPFERMNFPTPASLGFQPYNVKFTLRNAFGEFPLGSDILCRVSGVEDYTSRYDLQFLLEVGRQPAREGFRLRCVYNAGRLSAARVQTLLETIRGELGLPNKRVATTEGES